MKEPVAEEQPQLIVQDCGCYSPECHCFVVAILNPRIQPLESDRDTMAFLAYVPIEHAQEIVDRIRRYAIAKGKPIR